MRIYVSSVEKEEERGHASGQKKGNKRGRAVADRLYIVGIAKGSNVIIVPKGTRPPRPKRKRKDHG